MALFLICFCNIFWVHPSYVSVTNMDIDAPKGNIVLSIRIFTDDLETILHNKYNVDGWIGTPNEHRNSRRLLKEYIQERFSVAVNNGEKLDLQTDSIAIADDCMWFYIKGISPKIIRQLEIDNRLLTDFFASQTNLVIIHHGRKDIGYKLNKKSHKIELSL